MYLVVMLVCVCLDLCLYIIIILEKKCSTALMKIVTSRSRAKTGRLGQEVRKKCLFSTYCALHSCFVLSSRETEQFLKENMGNEHTRNF